MSPSAPAPETASAMKAVLTDERFSDPDWIYERKLDGIRCIAIRDGGPVCLLSRNDLSLNGRFPTIAAALERQSCKRFAIDGEVVAFSGGQTSFAKLAAAHAVDPPCALCAALDIRAHRAKRGGGGEHVLALEQSLDPALAHCQRRKHQCAVADRLVAGN